MMMTVVMCKMEGMGGFCNGGLGRDSSVLDSEREGNNQKRV